MATIRGQLPAWAALGTRGPAWEEVWSSWLKASSLTLGPSKPFSCRASPLPLQLSWLGLWLEGRTGKRKGKGEEGKRKNHGDRSGQSPESGEKESGPRGWDARAVEAQPRSGRSTSARIKQILKLL